MTMAIHTGQPRRISQESWDIRGAEEGKEGHLLINGGIRTWGQIEKNEIPQKSHVTSEWLQKENSKSKKTKEYTPPSSRYRRRIPGVGLERERKGYYNFLLGGKVVGPV